MTDSTKTSNTNKEIDDLDKPFTKQELVKGFFLCFLLPWSFMAPIFWLGAFLRTYPELPELRIGFRMAMGTFTLCYVLMFVLLQNHPRIIRIRFRKIKPDGTDSTQEQGFALLGTAIGAPGFFLIPWDAIGRAGIFPLYFNFLGSVCMIASLIWMCMVFRQNKFASRVVFEQQGRQLITTGLYSIVRHPMYLVVIPFFPGMPLCVGSYCGLLPMALFNVLIAYRTYSEEKLLIEIFGDKYLKYQREVPYRIIPHIF